MYLSAPPATGGKGKEVVLRLGSKSLTGLLVASVLAFSIVPTVWDAALVPWLKKKDAEARRPVAELAAQRGSQEASLWLGLHFPDQRFRIQKLADEGYGDALFVQSQRFQRTDPAKATELMNRAAQAGSMRAIEYLREHTAGQ